MIWCQDRLLTNELFLYQTVSKENQLVKRCPPLKRRKKESVDKGQFKKHELENQ